MTGRDRAALVIAAGIILWGTIGLAGLAYHGKPLGETGGEALIALGGALVGALAGYLAGRETAQPKTGEKHESRSDTDGRAP